jgi:hypothetical protein
VGLAVPELWCRVDGFKKAERMSKGRTRLVALGRVLEASLWLLVGLRLWSKGSELKLMGGRLAVEVCDELL